MSLREGGVVVERVMPGGVFRSVAFSAAEVEHYLPGAEFPEANAAALAALAEAKQCRAGQPLP